MAKFTIRDLEIMKTADFTGSNLKNHLLNMLEASGTANAIVEKINRETGEYRVVLQGTLEPEKSIR